MSWYVKKKTCGKWDDTNLHKIYQAAMHPHKIVFVADFWLVESLVRAFFKNDISSEISRKMAINFFWLKLNIMDVPAERC